MRGPPPGVRSDTLARPAVSARRRRWLPWLGAAALVGWLAWGFLPKPIPVEVARVSRGPLQVTVNEEGKTRLKQRYLIAAPVAGHLRRIPFKAGAEVVAGQTVLAVIDPLPPTLLDARYLVMPGRRSPTNP